MELEKQLVDKYAEMIITAHDGSCLWRNKGCDGRTLSVFGISDSDRL